MSKKETREEEELREAIRRLKTQENVIRVRRQEMEARLRRLIWQRIENQIDAPIGGCAH